MVQGLARGTIAIRRAVADDAEGIARVFVESAEYHASLDGERYSVPRSETVSALYRKRQHPEESGGAAITLVAECEGEIAGFIDARLERSPDAMHQEMLYCHVAEIAVRGPYRSQGVGARLMQAAEDWGRGNNAKFASLEYHAANKRAAAFYHERMGYTTASITAIKRL